jgi:hypothetical protein
MARQLLAVAQLDTVYADCYRVRARQFVGDSLSPAEYARLRRIEPDVARALKDGAAAVEHGDWARVRSIASATSRLRQELDARKADIELAAQLYDHREPCIDAFSPGLERPGSRNEAAALAEAIAVLEQLQATDPVRAGFYAGRRAYLATLVPAKRATGTAPADPLQARRDAMRALEHGNLADLEQLAASLEKHVDEGTKATGRATDTRTEQRSVDLAKPFDADVLASATSLGLEPVMLDAIPEAAAVLRRYAVGAVFVDREVTRDGATRAQAVEQDPELAGFPENVRELVSLFAINAYVNSGGARYLPPLVAEAVLVETFPESDDPPAESPLLAGLALPRRAGLSRVQIEVALEDSGFTVLRERLGLDPDVYKLVCIPPDVYARVGRDRGWGKRQRWTHFDGYQLLRNGQLRALVGGDVRYGGPCDLVSIARDDEREHVGARFAVVRRERMLVR